MISKMTSTAVGSDPSSWASAVNLRVKVHPVVLFQIADAYERRSMENHRVIGTLVGEFVNLQSDPSVCVKSVDASNLDIIAVGCTHQTHEQTFPLTLTDTLVTMTVHKL